MGKWGQNRATNGLKRSKKGYKEQEGLRRNTKALPKCTKRIKKIKKTRKEGKVLLTKFHYNRAK